MLHERWLRGDKSEVTYVDDYLQRDQQMLKEVVDVFINTFQFFSILQETAPEPNLIRLTSTM
jgi:hypothetical protein